MFNWSYNELNQSTYDDLMLPALCFYYHLLYGYVAMAIR